MYVCECVCSEWYDFDCRQDSLRRCLGCGEGNIRSMKREGVWEQGSREEEWNWGTSRQFTGPKIGEPEGLQKENTSLSGHQNISGDGSNQLDPHWQHRCHWFHVNN